MCRNSFASHRLMRGALSLCSCFRASDPALFAVDGSLLRAVNCARRRPLCEEKDDDTTAYRHLSPRTVAEISGVLFKERCLIKRTYSRQLNLSDGQQQPFDVRRWLVLSPGRGPAKKGQKSAIHADIAVVAIATRFLSNSDPDPNGYPPYAVFLHGQPLLQYL